MTFAETARPVVQAWLMILAERFPAAGAVQAAHDALYLALALCAPFPDSLFPEQGPLGRVGWVLTHGAGLTASWTSAEPSSVCKAAFTWSSCSCVSVIGWPALNASASSWRLVALAMSGNGLGFVVELE